MLCPTEPAVDGADGTFIYIKIFTLGISRNNYDCFRMKIMKCSCQGFEFTE